MLNEERGLPFQTQEFLHITVDIGKPALTYFFLFLASPSFYDIVILSRDISPHLEAKFLYGLIIFTHLLLYYAIMLLK